MLDECIDGTFADEVLEGENAYACPICEDHVPATRTAVLVNPPDHLVLSLNRFTQSRDKIVTPVAFSESLILCDRMYVLRAVIIHKGQTTDSGHYTAFINAGRVGEASSWFEADDRVVTPLGSSFPTLFAAGAQGGDDSTPYVLVYSQDMRMDGQQDEASGGSEGMVEEDGGEEPEPEPTTRRNRMRKADFRLPPQARKGRKGRRKGKKRKRMGKEEEESDGQAAGEVKRAKLLSSNHASNLKGTASTTPSPRTVPPPPTPPPRTPPPHVRQQQRKKSKSIRKTLLTKTGAKDYAIVRGFKDAVTRYYD